MRHIARTTQSANITLLIPAKARTVQVAQRLVMCCSSGALTSSSVMAGATHTPQQQQATHIHLHTLCHSTGQMPSVETRRIPAEACKEARRGS
jgi:uncharacterized transporter YbjL